MRTWVSTHFPSLIAVTTPCKDACPRFGQDPSRDTRHVAYGITVGSVTVRFNLTSAAAFCMLSAAASWYALAIVSLRFVNCIVVHRMNVHTT